MKMYKGKILKVTEKYTIVLSETGEFHSIKSRQHMVVSGEIVYTDYDMTHIERHNKYQLPYSHVALIASFLLIIVIGFYSYLSTTSTYAMVSLDINPSIDLHLNKELEITKVVGHNPESGDMINEVQVGMSLNEAVGTIIEHAYIEGYLNAYNKDILIATTIMNKTNPGISEHIQKLINQGISKEVASSVVVYSINVNQVNVRAAKEMNMSIGRYALYINYKGQLNIEDDVSVNSFMKTILEINKIDEKVPVFQQKIEPITTIDKEDINTIVDTNKIVDDSTKTVNKIVDDSTDTINKIVNDSTKTVNKIVDDSTDTINKIVDDSTKTVNKIVDGSTDTINKIVDDSTDTVNTIVDDSTKTVNKIVNESTDAVNTIVDDSTDTVNTIIDDSTDTVNTIIDDSTDTVNTIVEDSTDTVNEIVEDIIRLKR